MENQKYIIYCRKSSESDERQTLSIESQKKGMEELSNKMNLKVINTLCESKSAYVTGREKFSEMIKSIESGKCNAILTWHLTRLARNSVDGGIIVNLMDRGLLDKIITHDGVFHNTTNDKFMMQMHFAMSKKSSDDTSDFVKRDIKAKLDKGEYPDGVPLGYLNIDREGKIAGKQYSFEKQSELEKLNRKLKRVEPDPLFSPIMKQVFDLASTGSYTIDALSKITYEGGVVGKRSQKRIAKSTLERNLTNPFFYGAIRWKGEIIEPEILPEETRHEPLITRELFYRVQEVIGSRYKAKGSKNYYIYTNHIICGICGSNISGLRSKGHNYYRCMKCKGVSYMEETKLEEQLFGIMDDLSIEKEFLQIAVDEINLANEKEILQRDSVIKQQESSLKNCKIRLDNLLRMKISPQNLNGELLSDEEYLLQKKELSNQKMLLESKTKIVEGQNAIWSDSCRDYFNFITNLKENFRYAKPEKRREAFQYICTDSIITNGILRMEVNNPNKKVLLFNVKKASTITDNNSLESDKKETKNDSEEALFSLWRSQRDSNPWSPP